MLRLEVGQDQQERGRRNVVARGETGVICDLSALIDNMQPGGKSQCVEKTLD